jgi:hypothetical protein
MVTYIYDIRTQLINFEAAFDSEDDAKTWVTCKYGIPTPDYVLITQRRIHTAKSANVTSLDRSSRYPTRKK